MDDKPGIHSLKDARYMALDHKPMSEDAIKLCRLIGKALTQGSDRVYGRGEKSQRQFEDAIAAVIADLMLALADEDAQGCVNADRTSLTYWSAPLGPDR